MLNVSLKDETTLRFAVHAKPRAKRSAVLGEVAGVLEVAVAAPPADGEANEELVRTLAEALGVPKRAVTIVRGGSSRHKLVEVHGLGMDALLSRLAAR